jgi:hypothetical protein
MPYSMFLYTSFIFSKNIFNHNFKKYVSCNPFEVKTFHFIIITSFLCYSVSYHKYEILKCKPCTVIVSYNF